MRIQIQGEPVFHVPFSVEELDILMELSKNHYDATCRAASTEGPLRDQAFIRGWHGVIAWRVDNPMEGDAEPTVSATWRQLDLCLKILEIPLNLLSLEKAMIVGRLTCDILAAMNESRKHYDSWNVVVETNTERKAKS